MEFYNLQRVMVKIAILAGLVLSSINIYGQTVSADKLHKRIFSIDTHNDTALHINNPNSQARVTKGQVTFPFMKEGGLDAAVFAIYIGQGSRDSASLIAATEYVKDNLLRFRKYVEDYPAVSIAYCSDDLERNKITESPLSCLR